MTEKRGPYSQFTTSPSYTPPEQQAASAQIRLDEKGVAWIEGAGTKVIEVVIDNTALAMSPAQIHEAHPHLSPEQIDAALAYYQSHQDALDADITAREARVNQIQAALGPNKITRAELEARLHRSESPGVAAT